ncbi:MFS transporter [Halalkalicoccus ordinarius]|uniref:hypothetical protein n=1 Tax=Halalkalicoccus ordinarius TaxID=3116651 RepID=UPI00300EF050
MFTVLIYVISRYIPEYLRLLGAHPAIIGLFGSVVMLLAVSYPYLWRYFQKTSNSVDSLALMGTIASSGLLLWLIAPQLGRLEPIPAWVYVLLGVVLIGSWRPIGLETIGITGNSWLREHMPESRLRTKLVQLGGLVAGILLVTALLAAVPGFVIGFQVILAVTAAAGVTAAVIYYHADTEPRTVSTRQFRGWTAILSEVRSLPDGLRPLLIGDTLVQFALGMVSVFIVVTVTSVLEFNAHLFGYQLSASAFFGVLIFLEVSTGLIATVPVSYFTSRNGRCGTVFASFFISALFPLVLIGMATTPLSLGILFAIFGLRFAGRPAREALIAAETGRGGGDKGTESYRLVRDVLTIPSALIGGAIYAISPIFAFVLATVIGILGVREFMEFTVQPLTG